MVKLDFQKFAMKQMNGLDQPAVMGSISWNSKQPRVVSIGWFRSKSLHKQCGFHQTSRKKTGCLVQSPYYKPYVRMGTIFCPLYILIASRLSFLTAPCSAWVVCLPSLWGVNFFTPGHFHQMISKLEAHGKPPKKNTKWSTHVWSRWDFDFFTGLETCFFETHTARTSKRKQQPQKAGNFSPLWQSPSPFAVTSQKIPDTKQTTLHFHLYLEPQSHPVFNGWKWLVEQPFSIRKDLVHYPIETTITKKDGQRFEVCKCM